MSKGSKFLKVHQAKFGHVGDALVKQIKERIRAAPGSRWNKTGKLLNSIVAVEVKDGIAVVTLSDRLEHDAVARLFADEILRGQLDPKTQQEIAMVIFNSFEATSDV